LACAASLAVQDVIKSQDLLTNCRKQGDYLSELLRQRLTSPNAPAAPFVFDIRGGGLFWGIEFDFETPTAEAAGAGKLDKNITGSFAMHVQARAMENGLVIMGFTGGSDLTGSKGSHCLLSPSYTVTKEEVEKIVDLFVQSVEEVLATAQQTES
jgi:E3 ubiquitin-protein ligase TRIP12